MDACSDIYVLRYTPFWPEPLFSERRGSLTQNRRNSTIQPFNHSTIQTFKHSKTFNDSTIQPFKHSNIQTFKHSTIQTFNRSTIQPFNHSNIQLGFQIPNTICFVHLYHYLSPTHTGFVRPIATFGLFVRNHFFLVGSLRKKKTAHLSRSPFFSLLFFFYVQSLLSYAHSSLSPSLPVVVITQIRGRICSRPSSPLLTTYGTCLHFYRENNSAFSYLIDSRLELFLPTRGAFASFVPHIVYQTKYQICFTL